MNCRWDMRTYKETVDKGYNQTAQWLLDTRGFPISLGGEERDDDEDDDEDEEEDEDSVFW
jgi:hypothetical protein